MNIKCTKNLLDKLKLNPKDLKENLVLNPNLNNWHANLIKFGRVNTILLTHDKTLYSFFLTRYKAKDFKEFEYCIKEDIFKTMFSLGFEQSKVETILESMETITYAKTDNKSILASMNQIRYHVEACVYRGDEVVDINESINQIPLKALNWKNGYEVMMEELSNYDK